MTLPPIGVSMKGCPQAKITRNSLAHENARNAAIERAAEAGEQQAPDRQRQHHKSHHGGKQICRLAARQALLPYLPMPFQKLPETDPSTRTFHRLYEL